MDPEDWKNWTVQVAQRAGEDVGLVVSKGCEVHIVARPGFEHRAISRRNLYEFISPIYNEFGYVTTRVPLDVTDHRLREKLGFTKTWQDERFTYWAMTKLPYTKEKA